MNKSYLLVCKNKKAVFNYLHGIIMYVDKKSIVTNKNITSDDTTFVKSSKKSKTKLSIEEELLLC